MNKGKEIEGDTLIATGYLLSPLLPRGNVRNDEGEHESEIHGHGPVRLSKGVCRDRGNGPRVSLVLGAGGSLRCTATPSLRLPGRFGSGLVGAGSVGPPRARLLGD